MTKGKITLLGTTVITFIGLFFEGEYRSFLFSVGVTGFVGCSTNMLAIRMLFERVYLIPHKKKFPLPYSGILELQKEKLALVIGKVIVQRLISPEILLKMMKTTDFKMTIHSILENKLEVMSQDPKVIQNVIHKLHHTFQIFIESSFFHDHLQQSIYQHLGNVGSLLTASRTFRNKETITPYLQNEIKNILENMCTDHQFTKHVHNMIQTIPIQITLPHKNNVFHIYTEEFLQQIIINLDLQQVITHEIQQFQPGEMSKLIQRITADNLGWLEVWGGILGIVVGALFWILEKLI
ncbi:MAG: DUF445 family protein [Planctomycetes bacterium]|nr:DUF445 family protein [Planctomycetota bacterium]HPY75587.1 DUF445 family protein [Planctomycetota bacterium]HQB01204.1 DUF445 family protein [Planctomycetota bacterium]